MKFSLTETGSGAGIHHVVMKAGPSIVGRSFRADVFIDEPWVSRYHCEITQIGGVLVVRDNSARNGTYVNGVLVRESHLYPGDRLRLGMTTFKVEYQREGMSVGNVVDTTWSDGSLGGSHARGACVVTPSARPLIG